MFKNKDKQNHLIEAAFEYILILFPIGIYVLIETIHKDDYYYFFKSPEWAIANIFLVFQGTFIFYKNVTKQAKKVKPHFLGILLFVFLAITTICLFNSYFSIDGGKNGSWKTFIRGVLFVFSTVYYFILLNISKNNS